MIYEIPKNSYGEIIFSERGQNYYGIQKITLAENNKLETDRTRVYVHTYQEQLPKMSFIKKYIDLALYKKKEFYDLEDAPMKVVVDTGAYTVSREERLTPAQRMKLDNETDRPRI